MKLFIFIIFILVTANLLAQESLRWYPSESRFPEGECVRYHAPSGGESYVEKVNPQECKPDKVSFLLIKNTCYEVDARTLGKGYGLRVKDVNLCAPENSLYSFDPTNQTCYLVDSSGGLKFKAKIDLDECRPNEDQVKTKFVLDTNQLKGNCFETHKIDGDKRWLKKIDTAICRPSETYFAWRPIDSFKGDCWEIAISGAEDYANKVSAKYCRPEKLSYIFERKGEKFGDCFEVDAETQGQKYSQKVSASTCRINP